VVTRLRDVAFVLVVLTGRGSVLVIQSFLLDHAQALVQGVFAVSRDIFVDFGLVDVGGLETLDLGALAMACKHVLARRSLLAPPLWVHNAIDL